MSYLPTGAEMADDVVPAVAMPAATACFDPCRAVAEPARTRRARPNQRQRRAHILATIRLMLVEGGCDAVTMRGIAERSGHAVQTVYNLVGPREQALVEAISDYTRYVGRTAAHDLADPDAVVTIIDQWVESIAARPEFCRQVSLIFFGPSRGVFYAIRDRQLKGLLGLLLRQQKSGVLLPDAPVRDIAEQMAFAASALCIEWADRPFPLPDLRRRMRATFANLLASAIAPDARATRRRITPA
ncbi:MAG: TetR/AcrR family transcriptional regulator [Sphingomonadales bacterium]|nr:TetR/AcrR family transcriptional regulator [Sphingomonadales bacterium]